MSWFFTLFAVVNVKEDFSLQGKYEVDYMSKFISPF